MKEKIVKFLKKNENKCKFIFQLAFIITSFAKPSFAVSQPDFVSNGVKVFNAITTWILILIGPAVACVLGFLSFQKATTDDQAVIAEKNRQMKNTLISGAMGAGAVGIAKAILVAFGAKSW